MRDRLSYADSMHNAECTMHNELSGIVLIELLLSAGWAKINQARKMQKWKKMYAKQAKTAADLWENTEKY